MRFRGILVVLLVLFSTSVFGEQVENYNEFQYVEMELKISSDIGVEYLDSDYVIDFIKSDVSFFPRNDERQTVQNLDIFSTPHASVQQGSQEIVYLWQETNGDSLNYGYNAKIKVNNDLFRVEEKIKFPLLKTDATVLTFTRPTEFIDINTKIERKAEEIIGTDDDLYSVVFKVAEWTNLNINYNLTTLTAEAVQPSSWVLDNRKGVCDEMTNLFISFLRSVGIPARFVSGMVYSNIGYDWGPHGWAEVYFPEYGWVPFDVTFGEYGWLDPSHIKLKDDPDSGSPTARYSWKANGIDLNVGSLDIETKEVKVGGEKPGAVVLEVLPVKGAVGFGSYVPVEVKIKNLQNSYLATKLIVTKAPDLTESNVRRVLLEPKEEKSVYWIVEIPEADPDYVYTTTFEIKSMYGETDSGTIKYGNEMDVYSNEFAEAIVESHRERAEKESFDEIAVDCTTNKKTYYAGEVARIECNLENLASNKLTFTACFLDDCQTVSLESGEEEVLSKEYDIATGMRIPLIVEGDNKAKYHYIDLDAIPIPEIRISNPEPAEVNYGDDVEISFDVSSNTDVNDLLIEFEFGEMSYETFKEKEVRTITINTQGKQLLRDIKFEVSYKDELGMKYLEQKGLHIIVKGVPWYGRIFNWIGNLF